MRLRAALLSGLVAVSFGVPGLLEAQDRRVTGQVTREDNSAPLPGATVLLLGSARVTQVITGEDGRYAITVPSGEVRLRIRALGYAPLELTVPAGSNAANAALKADVFQLGGVVVTGQATTIDRRSATTAVAYVSGDEVSRVSSPTVLNTLAGKITGVNLQTNSGAPGGGIQMQIRGNSTLLGGFDPLYVVDGVIYSNASIPGGRGFTNAAASTSLESDAVNRIADLNPADIASIEVLKGAAASSIYGSKASNGVVVITTVRGQAGAPRVNVTQRVGVFTPLNLLEGRRWTLEAATDTLAFGPSAAQFFPGGEAPYFDHYADVYSNRDLSTETIADVSGGTENTKYFISGSLKRDEGIERNTGAGRQSLRVNVDQTLGDKFELRVSSVFARNENSRGWANNCNNNGCHGYAMAYIPGFLDLERRTPDGSYPTPPFGPQSNPLQLTELGVNDELTNRFTGGLSLAWDAYQGDRQSFRMIAAGGFDGFNQSNDVWTPNDLFFEVNQTLPGESVESGGRSAFFNWNLNGIHEWNGDSWGAGTSFGIQYEDRRLNTFLIRTQGLLPGQRNVNQGTNITANEVLTQERTIALYAQEAIRLFDEKVLIQLGLRAERSSVNGDIDQYYVFPKASGSYRFRDLLGSGSEVKLRAAYGETGNQPLFGQKFTNLGTPQLGGQQGLTVATAAGSPAVAPERLKEIEVGLDGEAVNGRLTWELTGFQRNTTNLLLQRVPAPSSGFTSQVFNGGRIENWGIEAALGYAVMQSASAQWISRATFTHYDSKVADLAGLPAFFPSASGFGNLGRTRVEEGKQITQIVGFDFNADSTGRASSLTQLGNSAPDFRVGFVNDFIFGDLSVNVVVDWSQGGNVINLTQFLYDDGQNAADFGSPAWAIRNKGLTGGVIAPYIEDASFVKLREVAINYELPQSFRSLLGSEARSMRVGLTGRNLLMFTDYTGLDPEVANFGAAAIRNNLDIGPYPPTRSFFFTFGVGF